MERSCFLHGDYVGLVCDACVTLRYDQLADKTWTAWTTFYRKCREEMEFRYGRRGIPVDVYKEQYALGANVAQACKAIDTAEGK